jgi:hypothetical protein
MPITTGITLQVRRSPLNPRKRRNPGLKVRVKSGNRLIDLAGQQFGRLTVIRRAANIRGIQNSQWRCRCKCGRKTTVCSNSLRRKLTRSCGCLANECRLDPKLKFRIHSAARHGKRTPEYISWFAMKQRCSNPKKDGYKYYGARGIVVCARWQGRAGFKNFLSDMGPRPRGKTLDREKVNGDYTPNNCRWATPKEQAGNRRQRQNPA